MTRAEKRVVRAAMAFSRIKPLESIDAWAAWDKIFYRRSAALFKACAALAKRRKPRKPKGKR